MVTLSKIAKLAHVSVSTASKAFSLSKEVSKETREEVFNVAKELGCFKKYYNPKYPKWVIAILTPEFHGRYYNRLISEFEKLLSERNCELCVATTNFSHEKEEELLRYYDEYSSVDGIINISNCSNYVAENVPVVQFDKAGDGQFKGIFDALKYFKDNNLSEIGYIGESLTSAKLEIFKKYMSQLDLNVDENYISVTDKRFELGGYLATEALIKSNNLPKAIICAYDYLAIGAMKCLQDNSITVPRDVKIVGYNNIPETEFLAVPLSTIETFPDVRCKNTTDKLFSILDGIEIKENKSQICSEFILRESAKF